MKRALLIAASLFLLGACQPQADAPKEMTAAEIDAASHDMGPPFVLTADASEVMLTSPYAPNAPAFLMICNKGDKTLKASADVNQLGQYAQAGPGTFSASGASFPGSVTLPETGAAPIVEISLPIDTALLTAIAGATTTRIMVGDGFAETQVDEADNFEKFAAACATMQGLTLAETPAKK